MRRFAVVAGLAALAVVALTGCFNPTFNNPMCGPAGECPSGTTCDQQGVCRSDGADIDAPVDTGGPDAPADGSIDAPPITDGMPIDTPIDAPPIMDGMPFDAPTTPVCPDGITTPPEECDDNNAVGTDDCTTLCRLNVCGDTFQDTQGARTDTCDDGNTVNTDACVDIGGQCRAASCGDGYVRAPPSEACDDRGTGASAGCGTCNATCSASVIPRAATGSITSTQESAYGEGQIFTLDDGFNPTTVFEFDRNGNGVTAGRIRIVATGSGGQGQMCDVIVAAINSVGTTLLITGTHTSGPTLALTHDRLSSLGNRMITHTVSDVLWAVTQMTGGAAGDCTAGTGCVSGADCASGVCVATGGGFCN